MGSRRQRVTFERKFAMRTHRKHLLLVGLVGILALIFAMQLNVVSPTSAQTSDGSFDVGDLEGEYGGLVTGTLFGSDAASLTRIVADGEGHLTLQQTRRVGGMTQCTAARPCTYVIQPSGFGTITCAPVEPSGTCVGSPSGAIVEILLSDGGRQFDAFIGQDLSLLSGHFIQQARNLPP
jgi:hypothetical protein